MISASSQGEFLDEFYAEVLGDLLRLSALSSLPSEQQRALTECDVELDERLCFLKGFQLCQRPATPEEVCQYLELLGIDSSVVPPNRRESLAALMHFAKDTSACLALGGDDRLTVNPDAYNQSKYLASVYPRSDILRRGSCTCSTVNAEGVAIAQKALGDLWDVPLAMMNMGGGSDLSVTVKRRMDDCQQSLIQRLKKVLNTGDAGVVLFPSGSDAEFFPLLLAAIRCAALGGEAHIFNYVTAAGEVGSGTVYAGTGQHFSVLAPSGSRVSVGAAAINIPSVTTLQFKPRMADGSACQDDNLLIEDVRQRLQSDVLAVAILHVVVGSKTGLRQPSQATVDLLTSEFGRRILIVVDACQFRVPLSHVHCSLQRGDICLVTASKFFTAPPFAGAVLLPSRLVEEVECYFGQSDSREHAIGLRDYLTPFDVSIDMPHLRAFLWQPYPATQWMNLGLHLRWQIGLDMMERYASFDTDVVAAFTRCYLQRLRKEVESHGAPFMNLWEEDGQSYGDLIGETNSIVSFTIRVREKMAWRELSPTETKDFHRLLTLHYTTSAHLALGGFSEKESHERVATFNAVKVMLGQPVRVSEDGRHVLRLAMGADMVVSTLTDLSPLSPSDSIAAIRWAFLSYDADWEGRIHLTDKDLVAFHRLSSLPSVQALARRLHALLQEDDRILDKIVTLACHWTEWDRSGFGYSQTLSYREEQGKHLSPRRPLATCSVPFLSPTSSPTPVLDVSLLPEFMSTLQARACLPHSLVAYDANALDGAVQLLHKAFLPLQETFELEHCHAVKSCPLPSIQAFFLSRGLGCECASLQEVRLALQSGCPPHRVIYDSPCKSLADLVFVLQHGVTINCNSYHDVYRIHDIFSSTGMSSTSRIGLRVNPLVGSGAIAALSTATETSKFGVSLLTVATAREGEGEGEELQEVVQRWMEDPHFRIVLACYEMFPFLTGVMVHVGSQGMAVQTMAKGVQRTLLAADLVDGVCCGVIPVDLSAARETHRLASQTSTSSSCSSSPSSSSLGGRRITFIDMGGGLSANYSSREVTPTMADYVQAIGQVCAPFFSPSPQSWWPREWPAHLLPPPRRRALVTEFGKALVSKAAVVLSQVEDVLFHESGEQQPLLTAIVHSGADLFLRTAYAREKFPHRISFLREKDFHPIIAMHEGGEEKTLAEEREVCAVNVVGPLCFSGDVIAENVLMPRVQRGDYLVVHDAGANTLSLFSRHCSRSSPAVFLFRRLVVTDVEGGEKTMLLVDKIRSEETTEEVIAFWG